MTKGGTNWLIGVNITVVYPRTYDYQLNPASVAVIGDFGYHFKNGLVFIFIYDV
jgi:hypothetical protein